MVPSIKGRTEGAPARFSQPDVGSLVAGRFLIEGLAGSGGMGDVFRARDVSTGERVALKLLHADADDFEKAARFAREARLLSQLGHPGIVAYRAHGKVEDGRPWLALEWLSGQDLGQRLAEGPLNTNDCVTLLVKVADALATAHLQGIVHRDIKPSNLFLRDGRIDQVTLLDFGIARSAASVTALTRPGYVVGTPGYMAPEQARGEEELRPSADVFALGCVAIACLTGQRPFLARHALAVLAKVLFEEVPSLEVSRPGTPPALAALVARMLDKDPSRRPADAAALKAELAALTVSLGEDALSPARYAAPPSPAALSGDAMQLLCVIVAVPGPEPEGPHDDKMAARAARRSLREALRARLLRLGGRVEWLASGALCVIVTPSQSALDQAAQAARCALAVMESWLEARVALTTGRGVLKERILVGEAIDRAFSLLSPPDGAEPIAAGKTSPPAPGDSGVFLDDLSAKLLEPRFGITVLRDRALLHGERESAVDESRLLLGRPTPCVGRERELSLLTAAIDGCIENAEPAGMLVVAPPGMGKSRLRHELLRRLRARSFVMEVLTGSGAPLSAGSPYGVIGEALRRFCEVCVEDLPARKEEKIKLRVGRYLPPSDALRVSEFVATMCGIPAREPSVVLRAAFRDPKIMNEQIRRAFLDLLAAECAEKPVLLVLEDLHWGDPATTRLVDAALVERRELPFFVLALARPEVTEVFPQLWKGRIVHHLRLGGLRRKASGELVTAVLGAEVPAAAVERIVDQAAGNALFLEELIRAASEGKAEGQPDTVLAMLQARISCLDPQSRRVLSAASIFGRTFWRGGLLVLLGRERDALSTDERLEELVHAEIIERHWQSRLPGEKEYTFRHALLRDAAYGLLTDADRTLGHRLSCSYLEQAGETDPMVLAEHAREGGSLEEAAVHYLHAATQSHQRDDYEGMRTRAEQGITCGARGEVLGRLLALELEACIWRLDWQTGIRIGKEAMALLPQGSVPWNNAAMSFLLIAVNLCMKDEVDALVHILQDLEPASDAVASCLLVLAMTVCGLSLAMAPELVARLLARQDALAPRLPESELLTRGQMYQAHASFQFLLGDDLWAAYEAARSGTEIFTAACSSRWRGLMSLLSAATLVMLGDIDASEQMTRECLEGALRTTDMFLVSTARFYRMLALAEHSAPDRREELEGLAGLLIEQGAMETTVGVAYGALARVFLAEGRVVEAREAAEKALRVLQYTRNWRPPIESTWIEALVQEGRPEAARVVAEEVLRSSEALGGPVGYGAIPLCLAIAKAFAAAGDMPLAREALAEALRKSEWQVARITDPAIQARYRKTPAYVRIRELHRAWF